MAFYNFDTKDEQTFKDERPEVFSFFEDELQKRLNALGNKLHISEYHFNQALGYPSPKGQCYEISYGNKFAYGAKAYMECHMENGKFVVDVFSLDGEVWEES